MQNNEKKKENTEGAIKNGQSRDTGNIDEDKQNKNTTQYVLDTTIRKQTQTTSIRQMRIEIKHFNY